MTMTCTKCGQDNPAEARFCGACGSLLVAAAAVQTSSPSNAGVTSTASVPRLAQKRPFVYRALIPLGIVLVLALIIGSQVVYTVDETEYVVITQFGQIQKVITSPGLKFKSPIETVVSFDNRLLRINVPTTAMPDRDSQFLHMDAYVRYKIRDPRTFLTNLRDESTATNRISNIAISAIREEVGQRTWEDIIGTEEGITTREEMMQLVLQRIKEVFETEFGVEIVDMSIEFELR